MTKPDQKEEEKSLTEDTSKSHKAIPTEKKVTPTKKETVEDAINIL